LKKKLFSLLCILIVIASFAMGCGNDGTLSEDSYDETTISIDKKGRVKEQVVESFNKDYYDINELQSEINSAINDCNSQNGAESSITLKNVKQENGNVYVTLQFTDTHAYESLQNETLFYGTINEAYDKGHSMDVTLKGVQNGDKISKVQIMGMSDKHIVILSEPVKLKTGIPIEYVSANVDVLSKNEVRILSESGGLAYVVLEK